MDLGLWLAGLVTLGDLVAERRTDVPQLHRSLPLDSLRNRKLLKGKELIHILAGLGAKSLLRSLSGRRPEEAGLPEVHSLLQGLVALVVFVVHS